MRHLLAIALVLSLSLAPAAVASPEAPFGHACTDKAGVRFCPTASDAERVPSFDGVPLDVDVTLPATGAGPFPTIALLHGYGNQSKSTFQAGSAEGNGGKTYHWNDVHFAQRGYAVVTYSVRGFARSCGVEDSRGPGCERGWLHFADQRYEVRDLQHLLARLVDEGVARPDALGATGESYGAGQIMQLAFLRDRVRLENGGFAPWRSADGRSLRLAAAWPRWGWTDFAYAAAPNGRSLHDRVTERPVSVSPIGVAKQSVLDALYVGAQIAAYLSPQGADPTADLTTWRETLLAGEPYRADMTAIARTFTDFKSAVGLSGGAVPLLIQNGWTDDIFPAEQALRAYARLRAADRRAEVSLQLADIGHFRGGNAAGPYRALNDEGNAFLDRHLLGRSGGPRAGSVTAYAQGCPKGTAGGGPFRASSYRALARGVVRLSSSRRQRVSSSGAHPAAEKAFDPVSGDACATVPAGRPRGTASAEARVRGPFTLLGLPRVTARVSIRQPHGQLAVQLLDVAPDGTERLVTRGVYRLEPGRRARRIGFELFGNGYRFERGHRVRLRLAGRDAPFLRRSNGRFSVSVSDVRVELPVRERPSRRLGVERP